MHFYRTLVMSLFLGVTLNHSAHATKFECGTNEILTVEERIKDCSPLPNSTKKSYYEHVTWNLVVRTYDPKIRIFHEVWFDSNTGLVWGDRLDKKYSHYDAIELDDDGKIISEKACASKEAKLANAGITEKKFGLPTSKEYHKAEKNGIREILSNLGNYEDRDVWSATLDTLFGDDEARGFSFWEGSMFAGKRKSVLSVRCVGR
jgi:hypothetical protein